jgi:hypothetical protein
MLKFCGADIIKEPHRGNVFIKTILKTRNLFFTGKVQGRITEGNQP